jgi:HEAT repeat protein
MKLKILVAAAAILGLLLIWQLMGSGGRPINELDARMEQLRAAGDVEALAAEAKSSDLPTARRAVEAMGFVGQKAIKHIRLALDDPRPQIRQKAATAYARVAEPKNIAPVTKAAQTDKSPVVRASAITALGRERIYEEMETLLDAMEKDDDVVVRRRATESVVLLIGRRYPYKPDAPAAQRRQSVAVIRKFWARARESASKYYDKDRIRRKKLAQESE